MTDKKILVIATAALEGGALSILLQFLKSIPENNKNKFILFLSPKIKENEILKTFNCFFIDTSKWRKRIAYDLFGFNKLIIDKGLLIKGCVNFQNIPARIGSVPQLVYMHQTLPFYEYKWNVFDKSEVKFLLYSRFYLCFIKFNIKHVSGFVVQTEWLAVALGKKLNFNAKNIHVLKPGVSITFVPEDTCNECHSYFLYPAFSYKYKNHYVLIKAFLLLGRAFLIDNNVKVFFTCGKFDWLSREESEILDGIIVFTGKLSESELKKIYNSAKCVLFPSKIESFGLPLIEAALMQKYIIAADLEYALEVLADYDNCEFVSPDNIEKWAGAIKNYLLESERNKFKSTGFEYFHQWHGMQALLEGYFE